MPKPPEITKQSNRAWKSETMVEKMELVSSGEMFHNIELTDYFFTEDFPPPKE